MAENLTLSLFFPYNPNRRFIERVSGMLLDPRCSQEVRRVWLGYWKQADGELGAKLAVKLQAASAL